MYNTTHGASEITVLEKLDWKDVSGTRKIWIQVWILLCIVIQRAFFFLTPIFPCYAIAKIQNQIRKLLTTCTCTDAAAMVRGHMPRKRNAYISVLTKYINSDKAQSH